MDERWGPQHWMSQSWMPQQWNPQHWMPHRPPSAADRASQLRVGHAEREQTAEELKQHTHAGRLELHEFEERVGKAYVARTVADLAALTADLPPLHPEPVADPRSGRHRGGGRFSRAVLSTYLSVCLLMVFIWAATGAGYFWPIWVIGPWGAFVVPPMLFALGRRRSA
jgi:Domain of unknown function (DUF1707)